MDITELIIQKLNHELTAENEQRFEEWLKESYTHEAMMARLEKMKHKGHDFAELKELNPIKAWQRIEKNETN